MITPPEAGDTSPHALVAPARQDRQHAASMELVKACGGVEAEVDVFVAELLDTSHVESQWATGFSRCIALTLHMC